MILSFLWIGVEFTQYDSILTLFLHPGLNNLVHLDVRSPKSPWGWNVEKITHHFGCPSLCIRLPNSQKSMVKRDITIFFINWRNQHLWGWEKCCVLNLLFSVHLRLFLHGHCRICVRWEILELLTRRLIGILLFLLVFVVFWCAWWLRIGEE